MAITTVFKVQNLILYLYLTCIARLLTTKDFRTKRLHRPRNRPSVPIPCIVWTESELVHVNCTFQNLTSVPYFTSSVNFLDLSNNMLEVVTNRVFENINNLIELNLSLNSLTYLEKDAFVGLQKLQVLILRTNLLNYTLESFPRGLFKPLVSLIYLDAAHVKSWSNNFPDEVIADLQNLRRLKINVYSTEGSVEFGIGFSCLTKLREFRTGNCYFRRLTRTTFQYIKKLESVHLFNCLVETYENGTLRNLPNLKYFYLSNTAFDPFPVSFDKQSFENLQSDIYNSSIETLIISKILNTWNYISPTIVTVFLMLEYTPISTLCVLENDFIEGSGLGLVDIPKTLEIIDFSNNKLMSFKYYMPHVLSLSLRGNALGTFLASDTITDKNHTTKIRKLDLSFNDIHSLMWSFFRGFSNAQEINLSDNSLSDIDFDLVPLLSLTYLDLSNNKIKTFKQNTLDILNNFFRQNNLKINLSGNLLQCSCQTIYFLQWINAKQKHFPNLKTFNCKFNNGTITDMINLKETVSYLEKVCSSHSLLIASMSAGIIIMLLIVIIGLIYRYRWRLRYLYYMTRSKYRKYKPIESGQNFTYDAFISYADSDKNFVINGFIPNVERNGNMKLCIHQRDFIPGEEITVNITNGIHESRKTICIITRSFLESYYCMFEFNMARMESIYSRSGQNILFLVFYEQILPRELPLVMLEIVQQASYIEYPNDEQGNVVFWEKIKEAIQ